MVLKASDVHPMGYPTVEAIVRMGKKLETATNGRISIQMFPSMQLGGEKEMIEQAQIGALQIARISVGAMGPVVDEVNVFNMPFVFRDEAHMRKVIDGPIGQDLLERMTNGPGSRLVALGWMDAGTRNVYAKKAVTTPEDLKGMKIRMMYSGKDYDILEVGVLAPKPVQCAQCPSRFPWVYRKSQSRGARATPSERHPLPARHGPQDRSAGQ